VKARTPPRRQENAVPARRDQRGADCLSMSLSPGRVGLRVVVVVGTRQLLPLVLH